MPDPPVRAPIDPPRPSARPTAPRGVSAPIVSPTDLVRALAQKLADRKRDEVLSTIENLGATDRDALEGLLITALAQDKNKNQRFDLRRVIRFARNKPTIPTANPSFVQSGGSAVARSEAKVARGIVKMRTGVHLEIDRSNKTDDAYSLTYTGPDANDMHWLQFIWRRVLVDFPSVVKGAKPRRVALQMRLDHSGVSYLLTTGSTDKVRPRWTVDKGSSRSAFYEENTTVMRSAGELAMFDAPSPLPRSKLAIDLFKGPNRATSFVTEFHAATFLVRGMDVLYRGLIDYAWTFTTDKDTPKPTIKASGAAGPQLDAGQRATLAYQQPTFDYLPGAPIGPPIPADDFDPIENLVLGSWNTMSNLDRLADVAELAGAGLIREFPGITPGAINQVARKTDGKPGLNLVASLTPAAQGSVGGPQGETGNIDAATSKYVSAQLPFNRFGPLPRVATFLSSSAFEFGNHIVREKPYAVATMRHEMMHATHCELAIGWLLKWRDELADKDFPDWLKGELKDGRISPVDFELVSTGLGSVTTNATELLAYTEGFVTGIQFLPVSPTYSLLMPPTEKWPVAITELVLAAKFYRAVPGLQATSIKRIRQVLCNSLTQNQRDTLIKWIELLLNPKSLNPTPADQPAVHLITVSFPDTANSFLKEVLAQAKLKCT